MSASVALSPMTPVENSRRRTTAYKPSTPGKLVNKQSSVGEESVNFDECSPRALKESPRRVYN